MTSLDARIDGWYTSAMATRFNLVSMHRVNRNVAGLLCYSVALLSWMATHRSTAAETVFLTVAEDTMLSRRAPDNNFGEHLYPMEFMHRVRMGWSPDGDHYRALSRFDFAAVAPGATIKNVEISVRMAGPLHPVPCRLTFHRMTRSWVEGTGTGTAGEPENGSATWNSRRNGVEGMAWEQPGGDFEAKPFLVSPTIPKAPDGIIRFPFPAEVAQDWLDRPDENFGCMARIEPIERGDLKELEAEWFASERENTPADQLPHLVVTYEGGDPSRIRSSKLAQENSQAPPAVVIPVKLPNAGQTSLALYDESGERILRTLWYARDVKERSLDVPWDGTDDDGDPVPAGTYRWKALQGGKVSARHVASVGNGRQPWQPGDMGGYDILNAQDIAVDQDGNVYICGTGHGKAIQKVSPEGEVIWAGPNTGAIEVPTAIALSESFVYAANGNRGWYRLHRDTGQVAPLAGDQRMVVFEPNQKASDNGWIWPDPFTDYPTRHLQDGIRGERDTRGLVVYDGKLYLPMHYHHHIRVYDAGTGKELDRWPVAHPAGMALDSNGDLLVITERRIVKYRADGTYLGNLIVDQLGFPEALAVGPDGSIYVTDLSPPYAIKVFSPDGKFLRRFGDSGSLRGAVRYDKLYMPFGIDVGEDGHIYTAEWLFGRAQKLDPDWKPVWSLQALYGENGCADRRDPAILYGLAGYQPQGSQLFEYRIDYATGEWTNQRFWSLPGGHPAWHVFGYCVQGSGLVELGGHRFYFIPHDTVNVFRIDGDRIVQVARIGNRHKVLDAEGILHQELQGKGFGIWLDRDGNGFATEDEIQTLPAEAVRERGLREWSHDCHIADDGTVYYGNAVYPMSGIKGGVPQYNLEHLRIVDPFLDADTDDRHILGQAADPDGNIFYAVHGRTGGSAGGIRRWQQQISWCNLRKVAPDGELMWTAGRKARTFKKPGTWYYVTGVDFASGYVFAGDEAGPVDIYSQDGLFVSAVLNDPTRGHHHRVDVMTHTPSESWHIAAYRHPDTGATYLLTQSHEGGQHLRNYEVLGLDDIRRSEGTLTIRPEVARTFRPRGTGVAAVPKEKSEKTCYVTLRRSDLPVDGRASAWPRISPVKITVDDSDLSAEILAFYDADYYYVAATVRGDESPGVNVNAESLDTAWSGDCLEIYIGVDPAADPKRQKYTETDCQILFPSDGNVQGRQPIDLHGRKHIPGGLVGSRADPGKKEWSVTGRIPWSYLGTYRPTPESVITGGFKVNLGDHSGRKTTLSMFWSGSGREWVNPNEWGKLRMVYVD